jgi:biopolymer transport protein ExbD
MSGKKRRRVVIKPAVPPNSEINITPLVDVVLVLLIIFMVVTPLLEKDIEVRVPDSEKVDEPIDVPEGQLVVAVTEAGQISINSDIVTDEQYVEKLKTALENKKKGDKLVFFTADDKTNYAKLVHALDGARLAGAETLGMATDKIEGLPAEAGATPPTEAPAPPQPPAPPAPPQ